MEFNPVGLNGMEFIEFCGPDTGALEQMLVRLGFTKVAHHRSKPIDLFRQNQISMLVNRSEKGFATEFANQHGPSACSTGFRVNDAKTAFAVAVDRGARPYDSAAPGAKDAAPFDVPAIYGIGDSLIYFIDQYAEEKCWLNDFNFTTTEHSPTGDGLLEIDHLTNNVPFGEMNKWCTFYEQIFNFKERRYFDIKGSATGLVSKVMRSPCNKITIPINEPDRENSKSQIQEYINEYHGSGIQHIALSSQNIIKTVQGIGDRGVKFLDAPDTYFDAILDRVPKVQEAIAKLKESRVLVDGDSEGYLLQIFTQNMCGPIFFEVIQRKNHSGFGEGNFQALFEAIERDQRRRGVL